MSGVCLSVCLSVSNFTKKTTERIFTKILTDVTADIMTKFWKLSASGSGSRHFLKDSSTLWDRAFFYNLAHISGHTDRIFMKILPQMLLWTRKSLLDFGSYPDPESRSISILRIRSYGLRIRTRFTLAEVCALRVLLFLYWISVFHYKSVTPN